MMFGVPENGTRRADGFEAWHQELPFNDLFSSSCKINFAMETTSVSNK